jgi:archaellum component FlaF (FlaF/FlaG flagellin family)
MTTLETAKNELIDQILATKNENLLRAVATIFKSTQTEDIVQFSLEQSEMLLMSEEDIINGRLVSENDLNKADEKWLF